MSERNIRVLIAFDGTAYRGWQRQNSDPTIQGEIEGCLERLTGTNVTLHGAGRTDAGVHALGMVANFHTSALIPLRGVIHGLNSMLPPDIRILDASEAADDFHSRYSATGKTYGYRICTAPVQLPTERLYTTHVPGALDADSIKLALRQVLGSHDFSSFEGSGSRDRTTDGFAGRGAVRTVYRAEFLAKNEHGQTWMFRFTGDGFLRHMVRNLVGTLLLVGRGKLSADQFNAIIQGRNRSLAAATAPPQGLTLEQVHYDPIDLELI